eukprot:g2599.t1
MGRSNTLDPLEIPDEDQDPEAGLEVVEMNQHAEHNSIINEPQMQEDGNLLGGARGEEMLEELMMRAEGDGIGAALLHAETRLEEMATEVDEARGDGDRAVADPAPGHEQDEDDNLNHNQGNAQLQIPDAGAAASSGYAPPRAEGRQDNLAGALARFFL